jgi:hypothetical protein
MTRNELPHPQAHTRLSICMLIYRLSWPVRRHSTMMPYPRSAGNELDQPIQYLDQETHLDLAYGRAASSLDAQETVRSAAAAVSVFSNTASEPHVVHAGVIRLSRAAIDPSRFISTTS